MALDTLAPDQRAVVQLVLQQGRSYADLAGLLGISEDAVRQRAHAGLGTLGSQAIDAGERGQIADFLLGQLEEPGRGATEALLASSPIARGWAEEVATELRPLARHGLPEIPAGAPAADRPAPRADEPRTEPAEAPASRRRRPAPRDPAPVEDEPAARRRRPEPEPDREPEREARPTRRRPRPEDEPAAPAARRREEPTDDDAEAPAPASRRRRPEPRDPETAEAPATRRRRPGRAAASTPARPRRERPRRSSDEDDGAPPDLKKAPDAGPVSRRGGALLLAGLAILLAAVVALLVTRGDDPERAASPTPTPTQTTAQPRPIAQLPMRAVGDSDAEGLVQINATEAGQVGFTLVARNIEPNTERNAYAVWLTGRGKEPLRLGFAARVGEDRNLATSGPEEKTDPAAFRNGLLEYGQMVVSLETSDQVTEPTTVVLRAPLSSLRQAGAEGGAPGGAQGGATPPAPTPTPTPAP